MDTFTAIEAEPLWAYPDEPDPQNETEWKQWWARKTFPPDRPFSAWDWVHSCWLETLATWHLRSRIN